jgi:hypothetical protein
MSQDTDLSFLIDSPLFPAALVVINTTSTVLLQEREVCVRRHESLHGERVLSSKYLGTLRLGVSERQI